MKITEGCVKLHLHAVYKTLGITKRTSLVRALGFHQWPDPTPDMLRDPKFNAIWSVIKTWDIAVPEIYSGHCGATGNHARAIFDALNSVG